MKHKSVNTIPYMGSKRKLATKILEVIQNTIGKDFTNFYDLFGGGGAVSIASLQLGYKTYYNELNSGIANLMDYITKGGKLPDGFITREEFMKAKNGTDWYSGFVKSCWSFGNSQKTYMYGRHIEDYKRNYHLLVVNQIDTRKEMEEYIKGYFQTKYNLDIDFKLEIPNGGDTRRLEIRKQITKLEVIAKEQVKSLESLASLQCLERLERLQNLESLERLESLEITNLSYNQVEYNPIGSVLYCDIPYKGTGKYQNELDYNEFYQWVRDCPIPVFISEYSMPDDFQEVASFEHHTKFSATAHNKVLEKLFWNEKKLN